MAKQILITGASGFIGSFLVEEALSKGFKVWAGVRKKSSREYLKNPSIQFIYLDFSSSEKLTKQLQEFASSHGKFDYIIHNAGVTKTLYNEEFDRVNFTYTVNFVNALEMASCVPQKFVLMSSLSVMGCGDEKEYTPMQISQKPNPNTAYGKSKLKAEQFLQEKKSFPYMILRPTGVYGPRERDYFMVVKSIQSGLDVQAGIKKQLLTFIYVKDLATAAILAAESSITNKTYFVTDGKQYSGEEYTSIVRRLLKKRRVLRVKVPLCILAVVCWISEKISKLSQKPSTLNMDKYQIMKQRNWSCSSREIEKDLHFKPLYDLSKGVEESIKWYKEHKWI